MPGKMSAIKTRHSVKNEKMTRVDGKGLWRSWKRNFKTKVLALLDLIDNSLDAGIQGKNDGNGDQSNFVGRVHVYPDVYGAGVATHATTTGLCIVNNCMKKIRPLEKVLEVYNSSKVESGAGDIGENGVGLKQGCATLSDLSFVLVKNGNNANVELGICAESLQREEGCYLPAFKFNHTKAKRLPSLKDQMTSLFSQPIHSDIASCIAQYGAASSDSTPSLNTGIERLCRHFDHICYNFFQSKHAFMVILDKVHHGQSEQYVQNAWDAQQKITVNHLMRDLRNEIPRTYLHIPSAFDFTIGGKKVEFKYWPARLVELASFTVDVNSRVPWQKKLECTNDVHSYPLRVFVGFDGMRITESAAGKEASLYVYSRQSGRLITHRPDARTLLGLSAGGTAYCQGLTIIIDDIGGNLPLNPTKQEVAFGEEAHGAVHEENLEAWVGSVAHFYYHFHLKKFNDRKKVLTQKIAKFGDDLLQEDRQLKTLDNSDLTSFELSFKSTGKSIRVDKASANEILGADTLYKLSAEKRCSTSATSNAANNRKRKAAIDETAPSSLKVPRRRQPIPYHESESEQEQKPDIDETGPSNPKVPRRKQPVSYHESESELDYGTDSDSSKSLEANECASTKPLVASKVQIEEVGREPLAEFSTDDPDHEEKTNNDVGDRVYKHLCERLTTKTNSQRVQIRSLKGELATERSLCQAQQQQIKDLQRKIASLEK